MHSRITLCGRQLWLESCKYLIIDTHSRVHWSQTPSIDGHDIDKVKLLEWTEYLIDDRYVKVGDKVYNQTIGIPMGTDCVPQLANLFLFHYEG